MIAKNSKISRSAGLMAGTFLALASAYAAPAPATSTEETNFGFDNNFIKLSYSPVSVSGNKAAFQAGTQLYRTGAAGIEELRMGKDLDKDTKVQFDGKVLTGTEDYLGKLKITKEDTGSVEVGYERFRTFCDGLGGFFPTNGAWMPLADENLHVDRQKVWAELNYKQGDGPAFNLRYTNVLRTGTKDTTIWGGSDFTGIANSTRSSDNIIRSYRALVGSFINVNDRQQTLEGSIKQSFGNTSVQAGFIGTKVNNQDNRYVNRYPGEIKPYPAIPATPVRLIPPASANNPVYGFDTQGVSTKSLAFYAKFETNLSSTATLFGGVQEQKTTGDISNSRLTYSDLMTATGRVSGIGMVASGGRPPASFTTNSGSLKSTSTTANLGVNLKPVRDLYVTAAVKGESTYGSVQNNLGYIGNFANLAKGTVVAVNANADNWSRVKETAWTPELDVRYTGIRTVTLYGSADYRYAPGDEKTSNTTIGASGSSLVASLSGAHDNVKENHGHYKIGASWAPHSMVVVRAEGFIKDHVNSFADVSGTGSYVFSYDTKGAQVTATVTPLSGLSFTTKLITQQGTAETFLDGGAGYRSNDTRTNLIGETVDWTPTKDFYLQGNVNMTLDSTVTSYPRAGGSANWVLHNADNNYWNGSVLAGMVIDKNTDGQIQYSYYKASNYQAALAYATLPYGAGQSDSMVTVGVKHKFTEKLIGEAKVGYVHSSNDTTGGHTNYSGTIGYVSLAYAF